MIVNNMTQEEKYIISRWCYSIGEPIISDVEYNNLHRYMEHENLLSEYTSRSWSSDPCPIELLKKFDMSDKAVNIVLSDKTESIQSITEESELESYYSTMYDLHFISYKHDGWNTQATYHNKEFIIANTRGRKSESIDLSGLKHLFPETITRDGKVVIIGEMTLTDENFTKLKLMYPEKNLQSQRSAVRTAMANKEANHLLSFTAFDILLEDGKELDASFTFYLLSNWGFTIPVYETAYDYDALLRAIKNLSDSVKMYPHLTDGLVVRSNTGRNMRAIRILNWQEAIYQSYVMDYEETEGAHNISIKLLIYPIKLENSTQKRIPITNMRRIIKNNLEPGSPVAFRIASSAIADIDEEVTHMLQKMYKGNYDNFKHKIEYEEATKERRRLREIQSWEKDINSEHI